MMRFKCHRAAWSRLTTAIGLALALQQGAAAAGEPDLAALDLRTLMEMDASVLTAQKCQEDINDTPISMAMVKLTTSSL